MPDLVLAKAHGNCLVPLDDQAAAYLSAFRDGAGFVASIKQHNNPAFHRKLMALFQHAFDMWEPRELRYQGELVGKNYDQFRKDLTILAGYYDTSLSITGNLRLTARSLNFSSMEQAEREALFSAVIDVILQRILTKYTRADLENVIAQTLGFAR